MRRLALLALLATAGLAAPAFAQSAGQWRGPAQIWSKSCHYCHDSGVGPNLRGAHLDPRVVIVVARGGMPGMPAFHPSEINDAELAGLARWLHDQPPPPPPTEPAK